MVNLVGFNALPGPLPSWWSARRLVCFAARSDALCIGRACAHTHLLFGRSFSDGASDLSLDPACCGRSVREAEPFSCSAFFSPAEVRPHATRPSAGRVRPAWNDVVSPRSWARSARTIFFASNLSSHKGAKARKIIEDASARQDTQGTERLSAARKFSNRSKLTGFCLSHQQVVWCLHPRRVRPDPILAIWKKIGCGIGATAI